MIIDQILQGIVKERVDEPFRSPLRMSNSGKCAKAIAYQYHGFPSEPLPPRSLMVFRLGHTIETEVKALIKKYCSHLNLTYPTDTISYEVDGKCIEGHVDGFIDSDGILEVKSINGMRFKMLDREGVPPDYVRQCNSYLKATGRKYVLVLFYCKDTSHLKEITIRYDPSVMEEIQARFLSVIQSTKDKLPPREYEPLKSGQLPWQCSYCSFTQPCWPDYELKFDKNNKPQWVPKKAIETREQFEKRRDKLGLEY